MTEWRVMPSTLPEPERVDWVVKEGSQPWSVNRQDAKALADYLNEIEAKVERLQTERVALRDGFNMVQAERRKLQAALEERARSFHEYIRTTNEPGNHLHCEVWEKCIHPDCKKIVALMLK